MNSDSESQDSDDGRRFRFATTRKDNPSLKNRNPSPVHRGRRHDHRSRSRSRHRSRSRSRERFMKHQEDDYKKSRDAFSKIHKQTQIEQNQHSKNQGSNNHMEVKEKKKTKTNHSDKLKHKKKSKEKKHKKRSRERSKEKVRIKDRIGSRKESSKSDNTDSENSTQDRTSLKLYQINKDKELPESVKHPSYTPPHTTIKSQAVDLKEPDVDIKVEKNNCMVGPVIPINYTEESKDSTVTCTKIPKNIVRQRIIGPMIPETVNLSTNESPIVEQILSDEEDMNDDDDDECGIGPFPVDHPSMKNSKVQMHLETRAIRLQTEFLNKSQSQGVQREEWMTELPETHAVAFVLESRKFKTKEGPDMSDRSVWTDTPKDRFRKQQEKEETRFVQAQESTVMKSDEISPKESEEKKPDSLLDMHLKTLKKKKKKLEKEAKRLGISTRRPFDRELDLQTHRLDEARKKSIFKKAAMLNDRFTVGKY